MVTETSSSPSLRRRQAQMLVRNKCGVPEDLRQNSTLSIAARQSSSLGTTTGSGTIIFISPSTARH